MIAAIAVVILTVILLLATNANAQSFDTQGGYMIEQPLTNGVRSLAQAIATAEGSNPQYNNPGDLVLPGFPTFGAGIAIFSSSQEGWSRLYHQLNLIVKGESNVYSLSDTIATMASKWTATDQGAWANNVAAALGVTVDTPLSQVLS